LFNAPTIHSFIAAALLFSGSAHAQFSQCPQFFPGVLPKIPIQAPAKQRELCFDAFAVLHSGQTKTPLFTVEHLTREQLADAEYEERTNRFYPEARLPLADRGQLNDYKGSGFDRGHMAPAADMPNAQAMAQSFSLSNIVPQSRENNRKQWAGIEKGTRKYVQRTGLSVYVFTGPIFQGQVAKVGTGGVWIPSHLFKLVYDQQMGHAWVHWIENTDEARVGRPITYGELVKRTGIEFLPGISLDD
jgi:endonuclease G